MCGVYLDATLQEIVKLDEFTGWLEAKLASNPEWTPGSLQQQVQQISTPMEPVGVLQEVPGTGGSAMAGSQSARDTRVKELLRHQQALEAELDHVVQELVAAGHYKSPAEAGRGTPKEPEGCQCRLM